MWSMHNTEYLMSVRGMTLSQSETAILSDIKRLKNSFRLSNFFKHNINFILGDIIGDNINKILERSTVQFDHLAIEVFGSLEEYGKVIQKTLNHDIVSYKLFPSVQFYEIFKSFDVNLKRIDVLKINLKSYGNIELFSCHQHYSQTVIRDVNFNSDSDSFTLDKSDVSNMLLNYEVSKDPELSLMDIYLAHNKAISLRKELSFSHIAVKIKDFNIFDKLVNSMVKDKHVSIFGDRCYYNPGDDSHNIKIFTKNQIKCPKMNFSSMFLEFIFNGNDQA